MDVGVKGGQGFGVGRSGATQDQAIAQVADDLFAQV